jgi:hypothetical protein
MMLVLLAAGNAMAGRLDVALARVDDSLELTAGTPNATEALVMRGDLLLGIHGVDAAAEALQGWETALAIAQESGFRPAALKAATRIARMAIGTDREAMALQRLSSIHDGFTEGFDAPDLVAAREVLGRPT